MPFPTAPVDNSGGILTIGYTDGVDEHFMRVHVKPFTTSVPASPYAWNYTAAAGSDTSVRQTAISLIDVLKTLYDSTWNFWVESLKRVSGGAATPVFPIPDVGALTGTLSPGPSPAIGDPARFCATIYDLPTAFGGRFRIEAVAAGARELQPPATATGTAGGYSTEDQAIVGYLTGANCAILGHDGHQPVGTAKLTVAAKNSLRRKYGFA